jgi:hypothetical protein
VSTRWIDVKESLPPAGDTVLVYGTDGGSYLSYFSVRSVRFGQCLFNPKGKRVWVDADYGSRGIDRVTHWMPLPEKP